MLVATQKCPKLSVSARSQVRECGFSGGSLDIKSVQSVANIGMLLVDSSTIKTAYLVSKII